MRKVGVSELKTHCLAIVDEVARTGQSVLVSRRGKVVARIVPMADDENAYPQVGLDGTVRTEGDIIAPLLSDAEVETLASAAVRPPRRRGGRK